MLNLLWVVMMAGGIMFSAFAGKMGTVTNELFSATSEAVNLCIFMLGLVGLWNGIMEIAVASGLMKNIANSMRPFIHFMFPEIPPDHKANEYIAGNMAANILGLGWAATPSGLKAMKELKKLSKDPDSNIATTSMCTLLVLNVSSLQLIPVSMIGYRSQYGSVNPAGIVFPAICATLCSTCVGILFIKVIQKIKG